MRLRAVNTSRLLAAAGTAVLAAGLAACSSAASSPPAVPASSRAAPASHAATGSPAPASASASAAAARACAGLSAWQKKHGNSAVPPQSVSQDLMSTPDPLSGDFLAWDLAAGTGQPDAESDLLKVWTDCAKAEA